MKNMYLILTCIFQHSSFTNSFDLRCAINFNPDLMINVTIKQRTSNVVEMQFELHTREKPEHCR